MSKDEAIREFLLWKISFVAWGKLAPRALYLQEPFEPRIVYEDSYAFPSHLSAIDEVALLDSVIYGHITRKGSISHSFSMTERYAEDKLKTINHFRKVAMSWTPKLERLALWRIDLHLVRLADIAVAIDDRETAKRYIKLVRKTLINDLPQVLRLRDEEKLSWKLPFAIVCTIASPRLLHSLISVCWGR